MPDTVAEGRICNTRPDFKSTNFRRSLNTDIVRLNIAPEAQAFRLTETPSAEPSRTKTTSIPQRLQSRVMEVGSWTRSSAYSLQPAILFDCKANSERDHTLLTGNTSVRPHMPPRRGKDSIQKSVEQNSEILFEQTRPESLVTLATFQSFSNFAPVTHSETGPEAILHPKGHNNLNATMPLISAVASTADINDISNHELSDLLIQKLYRMFCFDPNGSFRTYTGPQCGGDPVASDNNDKTPKANRKRCLERDREEHQNGGDDNDRKSSRTKRSRVKHEARSLGGLLKEFACLFCKRNLDYGYEARCIGWSASKIDTVLRVRGLSPIQQLLCWYLRWRMDMLMRC
jgi:hypothetical protein